MHPRKPRISFLINIFRSEQDLPDLFRALDRLAAEIASEWELECVFVVDGSPDRSEEYLLRELTKQKAYFTQMHVLSRNFGATFALQCGLENATGDFFAPVPPDMQDPPELVIEAARELRQGQLDVIIGNPESRQDPVFSKLFTNVYWWLYRLLVDSRIPHGGLGYFVCNRDVRDNLVKLRTQNSFIFGELLWLGYRRSFRKYDKQKRKLGRSSWSFAKKLAYLMDSVAYASLWPLRLFTVVGACSAAASAVLAISVAIGRLNGKVPVSGYTTLVILICFFGSLSVTGIGVVGEYVGRVLTAAQKRPPVIVRYSRDFEAMARVDRQRTG